MKMHAGIIECAVANLLDFRKHIIVPNISHGFFFGQESDMLCIDADNRLTEIEIKVSISDLKADFKKNKHDNPNKYIGRLIYAIPQELLEKSLPIIPLKYGIITVKSFGEEKPKYFAKWYRKVRHKKYVQPLNNNEVIQLARLGCMRIWSLKQHNNKT